MKKLLVIFAIAGSLFACNNAADTTADAKDSIDSVASETKEVIDSTAEQAKDSLNMIDSAANN